MTRRIFDRAGLHARRLLGQGKARVRGYVARRAARKRDNYRAQAMAEIRAQGFVPRGLKRKAHTWYTKNSDVFIWLQRNERAKEVGGIGTS